MTDNSDKEQEFELELTVLVGGYGKKSQQFLLAQRIKKVLEVTLHKPVTVIYNDQSETNVLVSYDSQFSDVTLLTPTRESVIEAVSRFSDITVKQILGNSREKHIALARQICYYLMYHHVPNMSTPVIGKYMYRDPSSIKSGLQSISKKILENHQIRMQVEAIQHRILMG